MNQEPRHGSGSESHDKAASLEQLRLLVGGRTDPPQGNDTPPTANELVIRGVAAIADAGPEQVTWLTNPRFAGAIAASRAGAVIVPEGFGATPMPAIFVKDVEAAIATTLAFYEPERERPAPGVHPTAVIAPDATVDPTAAVGAHVRIGPGAIVGAATALHAGAHLAAGAVVGDDCCIGVNAYVGDHCRLGDRVVLKPGAVIGSDGFGFFFRNGRHNPIPQIGIVVLEDDVQVGSNSCIDRAKVAITRIGKGTKVDNLVQVGHNCTLGPHCVLTAQVGLSGASRIGAGVVFAGRSGTVHDVEVASGARIGALSVATKDITEPGDYLGFPAQPVPQEKRQAVAQRRLPELMTTIKDLSRRVATLEAEVRRRETGEN